MTSAEDRYSRNWPLLSTATQSTLGRLRVGLVGCGLASQMAVALARLGIKHFVLWDGDGVDASNLNRQAFDESMLGMNKALATAALIKTACSDAIIESTPARFTTADLPSVARLDIVVNSIDFADPALYALSDALQESGSWCVQPLNLGFGGSCLVLGPNSPRLAQLTQAAQTTADFVMALANSCSGYAPSADLLAKAPEMLASGEARGWFPQNVIATMITTAVTCYAVTQIAAGAGEAIQAPRVLHFEPQS